MNKAKKRILTLALVAVLAVTITAIASAKQVVKTGSAGGLNYSGISSIFQTTGGASTSASGLNATLFVTSTYIYVNPQTGVSGSVTSSATHPLNATVSFTAPTGNQSLSVSSTHSARIGSANWNDTTYVSWP